MASLSDFKVNVTAAPTPSQARLSGDYAKPNKSKPASTPGKCVNQFMCSYAFTNVMQQQQFFRSFQINQKGFFIYFAKLSKSRKIHKNPLQTHKNVAPCLLHSSSQDRSSSQNLLAEPKSRLRTHGDRAFSVFAPRLRNQLPLELSSVTSADQIKTQLKTMSTYQQFS